MNISSSANQWLSLLRFAVRALRITASTVAVVALLRQQWIAGVAFSVVWLLILAAPRLWPLLEESVDTGESGPGPGT